MVLPEGITPFSYTPEALTKQLEADPEYIAFISAARDYNRPLEARKEIARQARIRRNSIVEGTVYNGYAQETEYDEETKLIQGSVPGLSGDIVIFLGRTRQEALQNFHDSVDDYIAYNREVGREANRQPTRDPNQYWFWTEEWQAGERRAQEAIDRGEGTSYKSVADFIDAHTEKDTTTEE